MYSNLYMAEKLHKSGQGNIEPDQNKRCRGFCFTINNWSIDEREYLKDEKFTQKSHYLIFGEEIAPTTGTPHLQGYIRFKDAKTLKSAQKLIGKRSSIKIAKGTDIQNQKYCGKERTNVFEYGTPSKQGERTDLSEIVGQIVAGNETVDEIALNKPILYHQYGRTLHKVEDLVLRKKFRTEMTECIWYWGGTGVGKSHKAFKDYDPKKVYNWKNDKGWQDGYTQQETVVINDFRGEIKYNDMLQLIDKWPYELSRRGREPIPFVSKLVIITSSLPPEKIYCRRDNEDSIEQLTRRIKVVHLTKGNEIGFI